MPTPLGNLRDITLRALDVLRACDLLVAEDTRVARRLLSALDLPGKEIWSYREQNAAGATGAILERARSQRVAVICDAGTPAISDPGSALADAAREAGLDLEVLPGPSAFVCALVLSGFALDAFSFRGFVPRATGDRERALLEALASPSVTVFYEAPTRIVATLDALTELDATRRVFVVRELTKLYEQQIRGFASDVARAIERPVRGEFVLVIEAARECPRVYANTDVDAQIDEAIARGMPAATIAKELARRGLGERGALYRRTIERKEGGRSAT